MDDSLFGDELSDSALLGAGIPQVLDKKNINHGLWGTDFRCEGYEDGHRRNRRAASLSSTGLVLGNEWIND